MAWGLLAVAIVGDAVGTVALQRSDGLRRVRPSAVAVAAFLCAIGAFSLALRDLPVSVADAVFAAVGTALVTLVGVAVGGERLDSRTLLGLALVVAGVLVLRLEGV